MSTIKEIDWKDYNRKQYKFSSKSKLIVLTFRQNNIQYRYKSKLRGSKNGYKGLLNKGKPYGFNLFNKRYGIEELLDCLERNEKNGVVYHRKGINGDYDDWDNVEELISFVKTGIR